MRRSDLPAGLPAESPIPPVPDRRRTPRPAFPRWLAMSTGAHVVRRAAACAARKAAYDPVLGAPAMGMLAQSSIIKITPHATIPGSNLVQTVIDGLSFLAIAAAAFGLLIGGGSWGLGSLTSNYGRAEFGKKAALLSVLGAIVVGASAALINWAVALGQTAK